MSLSEHPPLALTSKAVYIEFRGSPIYRMRE